MGFVGADRIASVIINVIAFPGQSPEYRWSCAGGGSIDFEAITMPARGQGNFEQVSSRGAQRRGDLGDPRDCFVTLFLAMTPVP
jgi:hypothetical protein